MCETVEDIKETLKALSPEIDIGLIYQGLEPGKKYCLVSVVLFLSLNPCQCLIYTTICNF